MRIPLYDVYLGYEKPNKQTKVRKTRKKEPNNHQWPRLYAWESENLKFIKECM